MLSAIFYPVAYLFRDSLRDRRLLKGLLLKNYLYYPTYKPLWFLLNDSEKMTYNVEYANKEKYYPKWVWKLGNKFLLSYYFNAIRNSCVNLE